MRRGVITYEHVARHTLDEQRIVNRQTLAPARLLVWQRFFQELSCSRPGKSSARVPAIRADGGDERREIHVGRRAGAVRIRRATR